MLFLCYQIHDEKVLASVLLSRPRSSDLTDAHLLCAVIIYALKSYNPGNVSTVYETTEAEYILKTGNVTHNTLS